MHIVLDGKTAFDYWMSVLRRPLFGHRYGQPHLTSFEDMSCQEISAALAKQDSHVSKLELLVQSPKERRSTRRVICRSLGSNIVLPPHSVIQIGTGIYTVSPELLVVRLATQLPRLEFLRAFTDLLGIFSLSYLNRQDLISRKPILTKLDVEQYLSQAGHLPGTGLVRGALRWVVERSASPRETSMDLELALPTKMGGQGLAGFDANYVFDGLPEEALVLTGKKYLVGDAVWNKSLVLEYNSSKHHDTEEQKEFDFDKITALQRSGKTVIPVSTHNFNSYESFSSIVRGIREQLGVRDRYRDSVEALREDVHIELLRIERQQREAPSLNETSNWKFLIPRLSNEDEIG